MRSNGVAGTARFFAAVDAVVILTNDPDRIDLDRIKGINGTKQVVANTCSGWTLQLHVSSISDMGRDWVERDSEIAKVYVYGRNESLRQDAVQPIRCIRCICLF